MPAEEGRNLVNVPREVNPAEVTTGRRPRGDDLGPGRDAGDCTMETQAALSMVLHLVPGEDLSSDRPDGAHHPTCRPSMTASSGTSTSRPVPSILYLPVRPDTVGVPLGRVWDDELSVLALLAVCESTARICHERDLNDSISPDPCTRDDLEDLHVLYIRAALGEDVGRGLSAQA